MSLRRTFNLIVLFATGFLFLLFVIVFFIYRNNNSQQETCKIPIPQSVCGNVDLSGDALKGKQTFNAYCVACHKLDSKSTGPALRFVDSVKYWKWLTPKKMKIKSVQLEKLGIEYHQSFFINHLDKEDLQNIYSFTH